MISEVIKAQIEAATVRFPRHSGQGVLVPGGHIVTAAHVVRARWQSRQDGFDYALTERIVTACGPMLVAVSAADVFADIAVLGEVDGQRSEAFCMASEQFCDWCESTEPVPLCTEGLPYREPVPVHILTHDKGWVTAQARQFHVNASGLVLTADDHIAGGTSGGPVVTDAGRLLGVVSTAGGVVGGPMKAVQIPRVHLTVPGYLLRTMLDPEWERKARAPILSAAEAQRTPQEPDASEGETP